MKKSGTWWLPVKLAVFLLIQSFNAFILLIGIRYLHPDFNNGYLAGKSALFANGWFPAGLFWHAFTAPFALLLVSLLVLFRVEKYPHWHRTCGKIAIALILLGVVPSGWILSYFAMGGAAGKLIFFFLSSYTAYATFQAWTHARNRTISAHRQWMREVFALLLAAIVLRLLLVGFHALSFTGDAAYLTAAVLSWLPSVAALKWWHFRTKNS